MATPYVRALKKAIDQHEHELANMKAALAHHEHADADLEIARVKKIEIERRAKRVTT